MCSSLPTHNLFPWNCDGEFCETSEEGRIAFPSRLNVPRNNNNSNKNSDDSSFHSQIESTIKPNEYEDGVTGKAPDCDSFGEYDVLWGRTKLAHRHPGNALFRHLVRSHRARYQETKLREEKANVVREVMARISNVGGRFLKTIDPGSDVRQKWVEVSFMQAYEKVSHALRSAKPIKPRRVGTMQKRAPTDSEVPRGPVVTSSFLLTHDNGFEQLLEKQKYMLEYLKSMGNKESSQVFKRCCKSPTSQTITGEAVGTVEPHLTCVKLSRNFVNGISMISRR